MHQYHGQHSLSLRNDLVPLPGQASAEETINQEQEEITEGDGSYVLICASPPYRWKELVTHGCAWVQNQEDRIQFWFLNMSKWETTLENLWKNGFIATSKKRVKFTNDIQTFCGFIKLSRAFSIPPIILGRVDLNNGGPSKQHILKPLRPPILFSEIFTRFKEKMVKMTPSWRPLIIKILKT